MSETFPSEFPSPEEQKQKLNDQIEKLRKELTEYRGVDEALIDDYLEKKFPTIDSPMIDETEREEIAKKLEELKNLKIRKDALDAPDIDMPQ